ncbi:NAD(P)H-dependent oxidoreductase [Candidatus Caldatribacterium saccharofermentans]|uniref:Flavodoxin family protein n=1 Tax=Candidatus Caldatribacterium saccharofermentans TaxID=1454753 RepID=A0A7V4TZ76_9BACT
MLIAGFVGSPRRGGNTEILVRKVLEGAASQGAETAIYFLNELTIHGCQACNFCKEHAGCRQEDDMTLLYEVLKRADGFVLGSPIYMDYLTAQTKLFLDRLFAFFGPNLECTLPRGKRAVLVYSQGGGNNPEVMESLARFLREALHVEVVGIVGGSGCNVPGAVRERKDLLSRAFELGKSLVE